MPRNSHARSGAARPARGWRLCAPRLVGTLALATLLLAAVASSASARGALRLGFVRCYSHGKSCRTVKRGGQILIGGRGFTNDTLIVFTVRQGRDLMQATSTTTVLGSYRLRAAVPSSAVSGPIYALSLTSARSNELLLKVHTPSSGCADAPGSGDEVTRWRPVVLCALRLLHQPTSSSYVNDVFIIIRYESSGDPNAINNWDSNAAAGDPSRGLMQVIGTTFDSYRDPALPNDIYDPLANIYAGLHYGISRYGSIPSIPGVKSVNDGGPYEPYMAKAGGRSRKR